MENYNNNVNCNEVNKKFGDGFKNLSPTEKIAGAGAAIVAGGLTIAAIKATKWVGNKISSFFSDDEEEETIKDEVEQPTPENKKEEKEETPTPKNENKVKLEDLPEETQKKFFDELKKKYEKKD